MAEKPSTDPAEGRSGRRPEIPDLGFQSWRRAGDCTPVTLTEEAELSELSEESLEYLQDEEKTAELARSPSEASE